MRKQACLRRVEEQVSAITTEHPQSWLLQQCLTYSIRCGEERSTPGRRLQINLANALWSCREGKNYCRESAKQKTEARVALSAVFSSGLNCGRWL